jgi:cytochrome c biogenesis protein ResB
MTNRSNDVRAEALHLIAQIGERTEEVWVSLRESVELDVGGEPVVVEYRPAQRELPVTIKLSDFRKLTYPGSQMAAGFESDVQLTDSQRGLVLMRKISMNKPLKYRGFSFFQSSYVEGPVETTVLSVRNDPGTPFVYAGFLIVIGGVVSLFVMRPRTARARPNRRRVEAVSS